MSWSDFWIIFSLCALTMLACRVLPFFLLKGRDLPESLRRALSLIPPAAFGALVANDLLTPGMFASGLWPAAMPFVAAIAVVLIALKTKSLLWSAVVGVLAYGVLWWVF